ncbi:MAG: hypothetical protein LBC87_11150 [Fibromonadaceae bacterium]|jgi:hypothetical protein|nr:hypothetical protein [Fibromonadaceae bacterium]
MPILILFCVVSIFAQGLVPEWVDESWRLSHYPKSEWYIGFATDKVMKGQPDSKAYQAVEKNAQSKLSESIVVKVQGSSAVQISSKQTQKGETINTNYDQNIRTASNAVLAKVETRSYFDKKSGYIYGFAAVKKKDLADFYRSGMNLLFSFAEKEFALAEQQVEQGRKKVALDKIQAIEDSLKIVSYWGSLLHTVESDNSYIKREQDFWKRAGDMRMRLQNGTSVYLDISGDSGLETLSAEMQEKGCNCSIAETKEDADYSVTIKNKLGDCSEAGNGLVFCYANATVAVNSLKFNKPVSVKIPEAKGGSPNNNRDKAAAETFKKLTNSLAEKINQTINQ